MPTSTNEGPPAPRPASRAVVIVVFDGVKMLDAAGPAEVFAEANRFGAAYELRFVSVDGQHVMTSTGTPLSACGHVDAVDSADTVLIAGADNLVERPIDPALVDAVKSLSFRTRRLASICTGSFLLAQAGLLDGRRATTHWRHCARFAHTYPKITVEDDAIFVRDGNIFTSAGVTSGIDLALALVEDDYDSRLVRDVARSLVVYLKRPGGQSQFSIFIESELPPQSVLRPVTDAIAANPAGDHSANNLAMHAALSTRQLIRLFHTELGTTPARYVEAIRIDAARAALDSGHTVTETARMAGFGSAETLRRVFVSKVGVSPRVYKDRFRTALNG